MTDIVRIDISPEDGLEWAGGGYLCRVQVPDGSTLPATVAEDPLRAFGVVLEQAKHGDFSRMQLLFDVRAVAEEAGDNRLAYLALLLLGDAGTPECYDRMLSEIPDTRDYELVFDYCEALAMRGRLCDVPRILDAYRKYVFIEDADMLPTYISNIIEAEPGPISEGTSVADFDDYEALVMERYEECVQEQESDQALLLRGRRYSLEELLRAVLDAAGKPDFSLLLRRRFEAATGIDCAAFYADGQIRPLKIAAIVEELMERLPPSLDREANQRYFFLHPIP